MASGPGRQGTKKETLIDPVAPLPNLPEEMSNRQTLERTIDCDYAMDGGKGALVNARRTMTRLSAACEPEGSIGCYPW